MDVKESLLRGTACALIFAQLVACNSAYVLGPSETVAIGQRPNLVCRANEVQLCRGHGHALRCTCSPF
jgi:hypothetical protein